MFDINNEKNKSSVILNPERSEWVSRSHVTGVEPVVNDGAKTKRYSAKRDLYEPSLRSTLKMTALAFIFTIATTSESSAETWDCGKIANTVSCSLDENGVFTISGTGKMKDYPMFYDGDDDDWHNTCPWGSISNIQTVVVGTGVTSIGDGAFGGTKSLTSITIPKGVTSIGDRAFAGASSLTSITIPEGVTSIGDSAFWDASGLTSITIPDSVTSIGVDAFRGASSLTSITIPKGVTSIGDRAFMDASSLTSITIPDSVTSIGKYAFAWANSLTSITIPDSVTSIGDRAFQDASSLTSITIPEGVTNIGEGAFQDASSLTSITIPDSVTSIGGVAFMGASSLTSITIPDSVTYIGGGAFSGATGLKSIIIPDDIYTENWNAYAFAALPADTKIVCQGDVNTCYEKLARYIPEDKGGDCTNSSYCISPDRIIKATDSSQCSGNYGWSGAGCSRKNPDGSVPCASGFVEWDNQCLSEYPFAKKRWTPAEANEWLHDGNDNFVVITFKK